LRGYRGHYGRGREELGLNEAASLLEETLEEEEATDAALTKIAESVVNQEAVARNHTSSTSVVPLSGVYTGNR
jgi:Domain of unknown function (DUF892)